MPPSRSVLSDCQVRDLGHVGGWLRRGAQRCPDRASASAAAADFWGFGFFYLGDGLDTVVTERRLVDAAVEQATARLMAELEDESLPSSTRFLHRLPVWGFGTGQTGLCARHSSAPRPPALSIVIGIASSRWLPRSAPSGQYWVSSTSSNAAPSGRGEERADRSQPRGGLRCDGLPLSAPRELRGMWITTVLNIDWPSRPGLPDEQVKAEYLGWLDLAQRQQPQRDLRARATQRRRVLAVQVRAVVGVAHRQAGQGDPGWDPMEWMVAETHARNMEFHAWFNPYRGSQPAPAGPGADLNKLAPEPPAAAPPRVAVGLPRSAPAAAGCYFDPGIPAAREFVEDSMLEAVKNVRHRRRALRRLLLPVPGGRAGLPRRGQLRARTAAGSRAGPTGAATTSTSSSARCTSGSGSSSRG